MGYTVLNNMCINDVEGSTKDLSHLLLLHRLWDLADEQLSRHRLGEILHVHIIGRIHLCRTIYIMIPLSACHAMRFFPHGIRDSLLISSVHLS